MAKKVYDLAVAVGTFQVGNETRTRWKSVGAMFEGEKNPYILFDRTFNPAGVPSEPGRDNIFISLFQPKTKDGEVFGGLPLSGNRGKVYDLAVVCGEYMVGDEKKSRWKSVGALFENDKGFYLLFDRTFNPAGVPTDGTNESIIISLFTPKSNRDGDAAPQPQQGRGGFRGTGNQGGDTRGYRPPEIGGNDNGLDDIPF